MPQNEHIELHQKRNGFRMDHFEREYAAPTSHLPLYWVIDERICRRKKEARVVHKRAQFAKKVKGLRAKLLNKKRFNEKAEMKKTCVCWSCALRLFRG